MANVKATMTDIRVIIPRALTRDITTRDGTKAATQPHISKELS